MCRDQSGKVTNVSRQHFSVTVHPSRHLMLFSDGFVVIAIEPTATISCLSLMWRLAAASEQTLTHMLTFHPSRKPRFLGKSVAKRCIVNTPDNYDSKTRCSYQFEAAPADLTMTIQDHENAVGSYVGNIDRGQILFGQTENLLNTAEHGTDAVAVTYASGAVILVLKSLMLSWGLAVTHSGMWTVEHETVVDSVADDFIKLFAVILRDGGNVAEDATRLRQVLELFRRIIGLASMDHIAQHLSVVMVTFIRKSAELFLKMRSPGTKGLHTLHGVALAIKFAEQHYTRTYLQQPAENVPCCRTASYLDHINVATDMFAVPSVFASDRLDWVTVKENPPVLAALRTRLAADFCCLKLCNVQLYLSFKKI